MSLFGRVLLWNIAVFFSIIIFYESVFSDVIVEILWHLSIAAMTENEGTDVEWHAFSWHPQMDLNCGCYGSSSHPPLTTQPTHTLFFFLYQHVWHEQLRSFFPKCVLVRCRMNTKSCFNLSSCSCRTWSDPFITCRKSSPQHEMYSKVSVKC